MYIFKFPARVPVMTYESLREYIARGRSKSSRKIGTTVRVEEVTIGDDVEVDVYLYDTRLVTISPTAVHVGTTLNRHVSSATREWLALVLANNDVRGYGLVAAKGGKYPQTGRTYHVGPCAPRPEPWQAA